MKQINFPKLSKEKLLERLEHPNGIARVIIDTDAANEIDDQFALTWALLSPEKLKIEAVTAEPFSFAHHQRELFDAEKILDQDKANKQSSFAIEWVKRLHKKGIKAKDLKFVKPDEGMELSYQEILNVYEKLSLPTNDKVYRGSTSYLKSLDNPIKSEASEMIIDLAKTGDKPLYILGIGCPTNIASAMMTAPEIINDIVVLWTSAYPSVSPHYNGASLNLVQDPISSRLIFDSGVPHVYLPGYHVGAQLTISEPEMKNFVKGKGDIGNYLYYLYTEKNPLHQKFAIEDTYRRTWVIWDLINIAWIINPDWVPTTLTSTPVLDENLFWQKSNNRHVMREAYNINRDEIFIDFYNKLKKIE